MGRASEPQTGSTLFVLLRELDNPAAWSAFVDRYSPTIYGWCRQKHLQDADAQDVTQQVLVRLMQKLRTFRYDPARSFRGWLRTLVRNALSENWNSRNRPGRGTGDSAVLELLDQAEAREDLLQRLEKDFDLELLEEAKAPVQLRVSKRDWEIYVKLAEEGQPGPIVAKEYHMTPAAVLLVRSRVQRKLKAEVKRLEGGASVPPEEE